MISFPFHSQSKDCNKSFPNLVSMGTYGTDARPVDRKSEDLDVLDFSGFLESLTPLFIEFLLQHSMVMISVAHLEILLASRKPTALVE